MMKSRVIQEYEENIEKLTEEIKKLRETANEKIKQLEQEKQTLDKAAKYSAKQLAVERYYISILLYINTKKAHHLHSSLAVSAQALCLI